MRRHQMIVVRVRQAADQRILMGARGKTRQVFTNLSTRDRSGNRIELTPNLIWGVRFHVERVMMADCSRAEDNDQRLRTRCCDGGQRFGSRCSSRDERIQTQSHQPGIPHLQQVAARGRSDAIDRSCCAACRHAVRFGIRNQAGQMAGAEIPASAFYTVRGRQ